MSERIGFMVVNRKSGYLLEGKDHAAKVFETLPEAKAAARPMSAETPVPLPYDDMVRSLLKGSAFCFTTEDGHKKFLGRLRNDPAHKPFSQLSQDRAYVRWRYKKPAADAGAAPASKAAPKPPERSTPFNPDVLVG